MVLLNRSGGECLDKGLNPEGKSTCIIAAIGQFERETERTRPPESLKALGEHIVGQIRTLGGGADATFACEACQRTVSHPGIIGKVALTMNVR